MALNPRLLERELEAEFFADLEGAEYVVGARDDRFQIPARRRRPSTLLFPMNTICLIEILERDGSVRGTGTGTLIAPQVVLTARHVLMPTPPDYRPCDPFPFRGPFFSALRVTPGADLSAGTPALRRPANPPSTTVTSSRFRVHPTIDVGLVVLPKPFRKPDRFMWLQPRSIQRTATLLTLAGYPCDKPFGTMWGHSDRIPVSGVSATHLFYPLDTCPGHSGSPIWLLGNNGIRLLLGVHTGGVNPCDNDPRPGVQCRPTGAPVTPVPGGENCGVRLNCDVITRILAWSRELGAARLPTVDRLFRSACR